MDVLTYVLASPYTQVLAAVAGFGVSTLTAGVLALVARD